MVWYRYSLVLCISGFFIAVVYPWAHEIYSKQDTVQRSDHLVNMDNLCGPTKGSAYPVHQGTLSQNGSECPHYTSNTSSIQFA
jgi:hypothetical protein